MKEVNNSVWCIYYNLNCNDPKLTPVKHSHKKLLCNACYSWWRTLLYFYKAGNKPILKWKSVQNNGYVKRRSSIVLTWRPFPVTLQLNLRLSCLSDVARTTLQIRKYKNIQHRPFLSIHSLLFPLIAHVGHRKQERKCLITFIVLYPSIDWDKTT